MSYKTYEEYKDSGVDWIGEIPKEWSLSRLKFLADIVTGTTPSKNDDSYYKEANFPWVKPDDLNGLTPIIDTKVLINDNGRRICRIIPTNSILVCCIGSLGKIGIAGTELATNQQINSLIPNKLLNNEFWKYMVIASHSEYEKYANLNVVAIMNKQQQGELKYPLPPLYEQKQIANYLNKKISKIDKTIAKNQILIELLGEKRTALINETVTKGLNSDVAMKDSGIEWIGEIPENWETVKLKFCTSLITDKRESATVDDNYIGLENIESKTGKLLSYSNEGADGTVNKFRKNMILFGKLRPYLAKVIISPFDGVCSTELLIFKTKTNLLPEYLFYTMLSNRFIEEVNSSTYGVKMPRASPDFINNLNITIPNISDQNEIINYLNNETNKINTTITKINENIKLLEEYKTSLIHHAVTGKIDVRDY